MSFYLYTETAFHHEGDMNYMKGLIDASAEAGAQGVKFQVLINYDYHFSCKHTAYEGFKRAMFSLEKWKEIFTYTAQKNLDIIFMPICDESFQLLKSNDYTVKFMDIHSVCFYDETLLNLIKQSDIDVILGMGGRTLDEIQDKINFFGSKLRVLMVGFQAYPSKIEEVHIEKIKLLKEKFPDLDLGYADHSSFDSEFTIVSNEWAYILGARFFEKHITTSEGADRWDFQSSINKEKLKILIDKLNFLDKKIFTEENMDLNKIEGKELVYRNRQKVYVAAHDISKGKLLTTDDLALKFTDVNNDFIPTEKLIGKEVSENISKGETFYEKNVKI